MTNSFLLFEFSSVQNHSCSSIEYGCLLKGTQNSLIKMRNSNIYNITNDLQGGNIYLEDGSLNLENTILEGIFSHTMKGVCVFAINSIISIFEGRFLEYDVNCFLINGANLTISDSLFLNYKIHEDKNYYVKANYGTLKCEICLKVSISNCTFIGNNFAKYGGGVTFEGINIKNSEDNEFLVSRCKFINNTVFEGGGAISIENSKTTIEDSIFQNNQAKNGGSIYFDSSQNSINITNNDFYNNEAKIDGGAIKWTLIEPKILNNTFTDNNAYYGKNIASFPIRMHILLQTQNESINLQNLSQNSIPTIFNISSGSFLPFNLSVEIVDCYGQIVTSITSNK